MKILKAILVILLSSLLFSCAASQFGWESDSDHRVGQERQSKEYIEDFDPNLLNEREIVVEPQRKIDYPQTNERILQTPYDTSENTENTVEEVPGFTVQLVATGDEARAREFKKEAILKLSTDVYWVFESAMYKIRTGQFQERRDAENLVEEAKQKGFSDAWIVKTKVKLQDHSMQ